MKPLLILDLDGVLITTPLWKADQIEEDGYSSFNENCVQNLNQLLLETDFEIWLSSTRRTQTTLTEFNRIFKFRNIAQPIFQYLPEYENCKSRKEEVERFLLETNPSHFLIIDDDKSLNELSNDLKEYLILTELMMGFNEEKLTEALEKVKRQDINPNIQ